MAEQWPNFQPAAALKNLMFDIKITRKKNNKMSRNVKIY